MPWRDYIYEKYRKRCQIRLSRHGNWRQWYVRCDGMCQYTMEDGGICGEAEGLEFHELFGEAKNGELKLQERQLLCNPHHQDVHPALNFKSRYYPSCLQQDITLEVTICGGYQNWLQYFNLDEHRNGNQAPAAMLALPFYKFMEYQRVIKEDKENERD